MSNLNRPKVPAYSTRSARAGCVLAAIFAGLPLWLGCSSDRPRSFDGSGGTDMGMAGGGVSSGGQNSGGTMAGSSGSVTAGASMAGGSSGGGPTLGGGTSGGSGGAAAGSSSGGSSGGTAGGGGSEGTGSPGCTAASPLTSGNFTETIDGTMRSYVLDVPANYDASRKYRLVFVWHPLGGSASGVVSAGYDGLKSLSEGSAVFVAADGLDGSNEEASGRGWWNTGNRDMKFLTAMLDKITANLCIDQERVFSTGFSFGGMMSYTVGYEFDVFRAIAPCSGDLQVIPRMETYTAPLPIMAFHGDNDTFVTTARGRAARDKYLTRNQCGTQTVPTSPSPCVEYQGCAAPTFWCEFPGGHNTWSEEPRAIWNFFSQF
jgi:polyhydroxybutyrate depolymerase